MSESNKIPDDLSEKIIKVASDKIRRSVGLSDAEVEAELKEIVRMLVNENYKNQTD